MRMMNAAKPHVYMRIENEPLCGLVFYVIFQ